MTQLNSGIAPLETRYAGYRFRSRIEARWAVFFTRLGLDWEYETQGFKVGRTQLPYLPDFYLPVLNLYVEVKPAFAKKVDPEGVRRWEEFAGEVATKWENGRTAIFCGPIPDPDNVTPTGTPEGLEWYDNGIYIVGDCHYSWCACPAGKHFDVEFEARGGRINCGCARVQDEDLYYTGNHPKILNAYAAARSARFEHGEVAA